jgi:hypothetical protein
MERRSAVVRAESGRRQALVELMSLPDTPDLHRGHRLTVEGREDRYQILTYLAASFVQSKLVELSEREAWRGEYARDVESGSR